MPGKPYSFRYPSDVRQALEPWRDKFRDQNLLSGGGDDFEAVVRALADRDRAIEDYMSRGIGQGILGRGELTTTFTGLTGVAQDITNLTVTATIPANRLIKISAMSRMQNLAAGNTIGAMFIVQDGVDLEHRELYLDATGGQRDGSEAEWYTFVAPPAGTHTWKITAWIGSANGRIINSATRRSLILVEDIGPINT